MRLNKSLYGLKQASWSWHAHLTTCLKTLGFQQCLADACVFRLVEEGRVAIIAVVHVDDTFAVGLKSRCDAFRDELNQMVPVKNLGELRWYGGCHYTRFLTFVISSYCDTLIPKSPFCLNFLQCMMNCSDVQLGWSQNNVACISLKCRHCQISVARCWYYNISSFICLQRVVGTVSQTVAMI